MVAICMECGLAWEDCPCYVEPVKYASDYIADIWAD